MAGERVESKDEDPVATVLWKIGWPPLSGITEEVKASATGNLE